jgi:hypothetical protein
MIAIEQIVDIPADRRLHLDLNLPPTAPEGRTSIVLVVPEAPQSAGEHHNPPLSVSEARAALARKAGQPGDSSRKYAGCLKGKNVFKGDPVEIQRKMRNEW